MQSRKDTGNVSGDLNVNTHACYNKQCRDVTLRAGSSCKKTSLIILSVKRWRRPRRWMWTDVNHVYSPAPWGRGYSLILTYYSVTRIIIHVTMLYYEYYPINIQAIIFYCKLWLFLLFHLLVSYKFWLEIKQVAGGRVVSALDCCARVSPIRIGYPTTAETHMWGTVTSWHPGNQEVSRCHARAES